jgi:hypothetical protein
VLQAGVDGDRLIVEQHGCIDNLMIHGALVSSGDCKGPELPSESSIPSESTTADRLAHLGSFRAAAVRASVHLLRLATAAAGGTSSSTTDEVGSAVDLPAPHADSCVTAASAATEAVGSEYVPFMREAIDEAGKAVVAGNHPFGAVLVLDDAICLRAQNAVV